MFSKVKKNKYGYYELAEKPSEEELREYYANKYYQEARGNYKRHYAEEEIQYINNKIARKFKVILDILPEENTAEGRFLDIGCGEGWALNFFKNKGWDITGLDYSAFGCESHNPDCLDSLVIGEINDNVQLLIENHHKFRVIWLDNVLEHLIDPLLLLNKCKILLENDGVLVIEVPNDFSIVQEYLIENDYVDEAFWITIPDHLSYFSGEGLTALCNEAGMECSCLLAEFPIDLNLFNEKTNYIKKPEVGRYCHKARITIENLLYSISVEKTNELYQLMAELGLGRQVVGFYINKRTK